MEAKTAILAGLLICSLLFGWGNVWADGLMVVEMPLTTNHILGPQAQAPSVPHELLPNFHRQTTIEALSVKYHRVKVVIDKNIATTYVDQEFLNDYDVDIEGIYIFPLPEEATLRSFSVYVDGKKITGEVINKEQAKHNYEDLVRKGGEPALLEYAGKNMFRAKIYPIPKHSGKRVELIYQEVLKYNNGLYSYEYPLDTERFSPKPIEETVVYAEITSAVDIKNVYSPSHKIGVKLEKNRAICSYEEKNTKPDKNFFLHYSVSREDMGLSVLCYRKPGQDGYFMLLLSPGQIESRSLNKDIVFVLDTSGSMREERIEQAKEALKFCINSLNNHDRFNIITFDSTIKFFKNTLVEATKSNLKSALKFVDEVEAEGGTNINDALISALKMHVYSERPKMTVFITDGEPSMGESEPKEILKNLSRANTAKSRIFVFGVGEHVDTQFLNAVSQAHRGVAEYVLPNESIGFKVASFYQKVSEPVLSDISLDFGEMKIKEVYPVVLPDIFKGSQLVLLGKYEHEGRAKITLAGKMNNKKKKVIFEADFLREGVENDYIPRIWATRKIGYLLSEMRLEGETKRLRDEVIRLSREHGVVTPHTSFYIGSSSSNAPSFITNGIAINSLEYRQGELNGYGTRYAGGGEVYLAASENILKEATLEITASQDIKYKGEKIFYRQQNGDWVDSRYRVGMEIEEIKYLSKEYFDLIKKHPWIIQNLSIGKNIIIVAYGNKGYRIKE